MLLQIIKIC